MTDRAGFYKPIGVGWLWECQVCFAAVSLYSKAHHDSWHLIGPKPITVSQADLERAPGDAATQIAMARVEQYRTPTPPPSEADGPRAPGG